MKKYTVLKVLGFAPGTVLGLTLAQAEVRSHALKTITAAVEGKPGVYEVVTRVEFKAGETVLTDADVNKGWLNRWNPRPPQRPRRRTRQRPQRRARSWRR